MRCIHTHDGQRGVRSMPLPARGALRRMGLLLLSLLLLAWEGRASTRTSTSTSIGVGIDSRRRMGPPAAWMADCGQVSACCLPQTRNGMDPLPAHPPPLFLGPPPTADQHTTHTPHTHHNLTKPDPLDEPGDSSSGADGRRRAVDGVRPSVGPRHGAPASSRAASIPNAARGQQRQQQEQQQRRQW